jgi:hypothetical protein
MNNVLTYYWVIGSDSFMLEDGKVKASSDEVAVNLITESLSDRILDLIADEDCDFGMQITKIKE